MIFFFKQKILLKAHAYVSVQRFVSLRLVTFFFFNSTKCEVKISAECHTTYNNNPYQQQQQMLEITKNWTRWLPNHSKLLANFQNEMRRRKSVRLKITERTLSVTALRLNCLLLKMPFIVFITCYTMKSMIFCCFLIFIIIFIAVVQFMLLLLLGTCWDCDVYIALYQFFIPLNKRSEVFDLTFAAKF